MNPTPTLSDFQNAGWQDCINTSSEKSCAHYCGLFRLESEKRHLAGQATETAIFTRLAAWTGAPFDVNNASPFLSVVLDAIPDEEFLLLRGLAQAATDDELKARLADLAWQGRVNNRRDPDSARLAIGSYLGAAARFPNQWREEANRMERALKLALSLGKQAPEPEVVWAAIEARLSQINGEDDSFLSERLMQLLQEARRGDGTVYAPMAGRAAGRAMAQKGVGQHDKVRRYWEVKAAWHQAESEEWFDALQKAAESFVTEAGDELAGFYGAPNPIGAAMHLQRAVEAYRSVVPNDRFQSRIHELHREMIQVNGEARKAFESHAQTVDLSRFVEAATNEVKGFSASEALRRLVLLAPSPDVATLRDEVPLANDEMVELLCCYQQVNAAGQVVASRPSLLSPNPEEREEATRYEMFRLAGHHRDLMVNGLILPALWQLHREHRFSNRDWTALLRHSPFVPQGREWLFARGFQAGWDGDWDVATHLLAPQVENSIRHILFQNSVLASTLRSGVQSEQGLDQTLLKPELALLLGENLVFDLRGLLTEKAGGYLRHKTAHGLAAFDEFYSVHSVYLWWLTLRLCLLPLISSLPTTQNTPPPPEPENSS